MNLLKSLFGKNINIKLNGEALAQSTKIEESAQIELLAYFSDGAAVHDMLTLQRWTRVLPHPYEEIIARFVAEGWIASASGVGSASGAKETYRVTDAGMPFVRLYQARLAQAKAEVMPKVRAALKARDTGEALDLRRQYEGQYPLGEADWTGPEPQMSHSALTRRILFLDHWLLDGVSAETAEWLKLYAAEQHLWGAYWRIAADEIPAAVLAELTNDSMPAAEMAYWKAYQLAILVDNQETWQRCKGGDHVRRIRVTGHPEGESCSHCQENIGQEFLVLRVPELPHKTCTSTRGCLCLYEPVLDTYEGDS